MIKKYLVIVLMLVSSKVETGMVKNEVGVIENTLNEEEFTINIFIHGTHRTFHAAGYIPGLGAKLYHPEGLYKLEECYKDYIYKKITTTLITSCPEEFAHDRFYIFCWSGKLCPHERFEAGRKLHESINKLKMEYGKKCKINLITHSHGGNVALNLALFKHDALYTISNLILLAVPVQQLTEGYVDDSLFEEVFSIYSRGDLIQVLDPQGLGQRRKIVRQAFTNEGQEQADLKESIPLFSQRKFKSMKVKHIEIQDTMFWGYRPIMHIEFILPHFMRNLGSILQKARLHNFSAIPDLVINIEKRNFLESLFK